MSEIDAYAAGLIDGEGSILLEPRPRKFRSPCVCMTNTDYGLIRFLSENYGGTVVTQKTYKDHYKPAWIWRLRHTKAIDFCRKMLPYLRHEEKIRRATLLVIRYDEVTVRNGKYNTAEYRDKALFEEEFFRG